MQNHVYVSIIVMLTARVLPTPIIYCFLLLFFLLKNIDCGYLLELPHLFYNREKITVYCIHVGVFCNVTYLDRETV